MAKRRRTVSDPREIAGLVLRTPGLVGILAETIASVGIDPKLARVAVVRSLVDLANEWPGVLGWGIDNEGDPYLYRRS